MLPYGSVRLQLMTARSAKSFTYRFPDMRGLKKTLTAGKVFTNSAAASRNSAKRSTDNPPLRLTLAPRRSGPPFVASGAPKTIEPVTPTESDVQLLLEKGKAKFFSVTWGDGSSPPKSASHAKGILSTR